MSDSWLVRNQQSRGHYHDSRDAGAERRYDDARISVTCGRMDEARNMSCFDHDFQGNQCASKVPNLTNLSWRMCSTTKDFDFDFDCVINGHTWRLIELNYGELRRTVHMKCTWRLTAPTSKFRQKVQIYVSFHSLFPKRWINAPCGSSHTIQHM